jgi:glucokinase
MDPAAPCLGIDLGGSKILAAVVAPDGGVVARAKRRTRPEGGYAAVLDRMHEVASAALAEAGLEPQGLRGIGIGVPGPVDRSGRELLHAANLGWHHCQLAADLETRFLGCRVTLGNDVNFGALGEATHGAAKDSASSFAAFMGTGLGGGLVLDGRVVTGAHGFAGEIGHMRGPFDEAPCGCGQRGCLETVASKTGIQRLLAMERAAGRPCLIERGNRLRSSALASAWQQQCPTTVAVLERAARALGWGLAVVQAVVDPAVFVLGGGVLEDLGAELRPFIQQAMAEQTFFSGRAPADLRLAALGGAAVAVGAAVAAREAAALEANA